MVNLNTRKYKYLGVMLHDAIASFASFYLAVQLRHDLASIPIQYIDKLPVMLLVVVATQCIVFYFFKLHLAIWKYTSTEDLSKLIKAATFAVLMSLVALFVLIRLENIPRSIFFIDWFILITFMGGSRFIYKMNKDKREKFKVTGGNLIPVLIVGAGNAGSQLAKEILKSPKINLKVIGFVDDNKNKLKRTIFNIPVLGVSSDIPDLIKKHSIQKVMIAIPSAKNQQIKRIIDFCQDEQVEIQTLPKISDLILGDVELSQLRTIQPEELLGRDAVALDNSSLGNMLTDKVVMVTGAGGSIGSELVRQIIPYNPSHLILFDVSEFFLYEIEMELRYKYPRLRFSAIIGDVRNKDQLDFIFNQYKPNTVFHAAAYKHVPLMEHHPVQAIKTNILGTYNIATAAKENKVERFVLVSTDKAVNPTNIMGTTKRVAEMTCQYIQSQTKDTVFSVVRFGNVLGSNGSVVPLFKKQIENGGPITVTHPEITRFFMSISEASQLVMQAGAISNKDEIFVLDMGEPVKIVDLAKQMINLSGLRPNVDITIEYIGLRPGEKLYEELLADEELTKPSAHPLLRIAAHREIPANFGDVIAKMQSITESTSLENIKRTLKEIVPEYHPY